MNAWMKDGDEDGIDLLLFQYLEGQLPAGQAKALEARIVADTALQAQLEYWQEAFVQGYYPGSGLEIVNHGVVGHGK